jgi:hypothetical protein
MSPENVPRKMDVRCYGYKTRRRTWVASCIDLSLMVERPSMEESIHALHDQIVLYVQSVLDTEDKESISYLLPRQAPWHDYVIYYLISLAVWLRRLLKIPVFKEIIPLPQAA